jgi:hypothetical protein
MSHRLGSFINSDFFVIDKNDNNTGSKNVVKTNNDMSFYVKGDDNSDSSNDSQQDVFIINGDNGSFQLSRKTLRETLLELKPYSNVSVRDLPAAQTESFKSIVEALRLLYGSQALYDLVLGDIRDIFSDVGEVKPGTVSAFFIGCFNDDKFPGPMGCSPKCTASLPPTDGTPGYTNCDDLVLIYSDGLFSSLNEKRSSHAYIYISDHSFSGFSKENIQQLKDAGIENVSLIYGNEDGSYREVTSPTSIDNLPRNEKVTNSTSDGAANNNGAGTGIVFGIIIFVIIILLIVVLYRNS